jgi:hypothetical protein
VRGPYSTEHHEALGKEFTDGQVPVASIVVKVEIEESMVRTSYSERLER